MLVIYSMTDINVDKNIRRLDGQEQKPWESTICQWVTQPH